MLSRFRVQKPANAVIYASSLRTYFDNAHKSNTSSTYINIRGERDPDVRKSICGRQRSIRNLPQHCWASMPEGPVGFVVLPHADR